MTLSKIIEQLKAAEQNKTGMFELGEDVMCALVDLLERRERDGQEPVAYMVCGYTLLHAHDPKVDEYLNRATPLYAAPPAPDIGDVRVGRLPTMNQDEYPGLGDWWVQLRIGEDSEEVLARVYGATPQEANNRAETLACRAAALNQTHVKQPVSEPFRLVGEVVAWDHPTKERSVDFRWLNYDVAPGTQLYAILRESE